MVRCWLPLCVFALLGAAPVSAREALGTFGEWAAFSDSKPDRLCYAISQPAQSAGVRGAYLTISSWPDKGEREQVGVVAATRLQPSSALTVRVGGQPFTLFTKDDGAWTENAAQDRKLVQAMRRGSALTVEAVNAAGKKFTQRYSLRGLSAALDAARTACR